MGLWLHTDFKSIFFDEEKNHIFRKVTTVNEVQYFVCEYDNCQAKLKTVVNSDVFEHYGEQHIDSVENARHLYVAMKFKHRIKIHAKSAALDGLSPKEIYEKVQAEFPNVRLTDSVRKKQLIIISRIRYLRRLLRPTDQVPVTSVTVPISRPERPKRAAAPTDFLALSGRKRRRGQ